MKNNTKVRLHLSKQLFESLTKEIIKEAKANDGYTVAVKQPKMPKQSKAQAASPEVQKTDKEATMGEMETKVAEEGKASEAKEGLHKVMADIKKLSKEDMHKLHAALGKHVKESKETLKEYEHHYKMVNGQCRRYNDEGEYDVVSSHYCH